MAKGIHMPLDHTPPEQQRQQAEDRREAAEEGRQNAEQDREVTEESPQFSGVYEERC
jgi:hypothetical protein